MRARSLSVIPIAAFALAAACHGSTGGALVDFPAAVAGPADATAGAPFTFINDAGWVVTLTKARLMVGAMYLGSARPASGAQATACILPSTYVAQATDGIFADLLSPAPQRFPTLAHGTAGPALAAQVWLASGDVDAIDDRQAALQVEGTATKDGDVRPFTGRVSIGANRLGGGASAGSASPCHERIVQLTDASIDVATHGGLLLRVDPRGLLARVDFATLDPPPAGKPYAIPDDASPTGDEVFRELQGEDHAYALAWTDGLDQAAVGDPIHPPGAPRACSAGAAASDGFALQSFCPPGDPGAGGVLVTASGEKLARTGYRFPQLRPGDAAFVDGWDVTFARVLVTVDKVRLAANPDRVPGDESQTDGVVAEVDGPWAIDLSHDDPSYLEGKGGSGEEAVPIAAIAGGALATDGTRYAFDYDAVPATARAQNVNLDGAAMDDYEAMTKSGCTVLYVGTATFKGDKRDPACYPPEYQGWPDVVDFRLCFQSPTTYLNCQNPDNDPAGALAGEEHERGIAPRADASVLAQVTIHTDHPFWDSVLHDSPAHFDPFAARVSNAGDGGRPLVTLDMTRGIDLAAIPDALGRPLPWRYCMEPPTDVHPKLAGPMRLDTQSVPRAIGGDPSSGLRDQLDFVTYDQSTQGHLSSDGLCYVKRNYPSPP